jgi:hypothetical protein
MVQDGFIMAVDWDLLNEDCADISDWTDNDTGDGVSSQETFDSKSCFKFLKPTADGNYASRFIDIGSFSGNYTLEFMIYLDNIGVMESGGDYNGVQIQARGPTYRLAVNIGTNGLSVRDSTQWNLISGISIVQDEWHKYRFEVHNSQTDVDIYIDDILKTIDADCSLATTGSDGRVYYWAISDSLPNVLTYVDWVKADTGVGNMYFDVGFRVRGGSTTHRIGVTTLSGHKLRINDGSTTYGIVLAAVSDDDASPLRIYDGNNIKALPKLDY